MILVKGICFLCEANNKMQKESKINSKFAIKQW